ncbi:MAG TPA: hypothetical protein VNJ09_11360 [Chthonomonadales bacterium]|nr:hypothetical protein [Chthonomonadales bacterium]
MLGGITIGDAMSVIALVIGVGVSAWGMLVGVALICSHRAARAREHLEKAPWRAFVIGAALVITVGVIALNLLNVTNGVVKLIGWALLVMLFATSAFGGAGLVQLVGERIGKLDGQISPYVALARGAGLIVLMGLMPVFGWFAFAPAALLVSLGAGFQALIVRAQPQVTPAVATQPGVEGHP